MLDHTVLALEEQVAREDSFVLVLQVLQCSWEEFQGCLARLRKEVCPAASSYVQQVLICAKYEHIDCWPALKSFWLAQLPNNIREKAPCMQKARLALDTACQALNASLTPSGCDMPREAIKDRLYWDKLKEQLARAESELLRYHRASSFFLLAGAGNSHDPDMIEDVPRLEFHAWMSSLEERVSTLLFASCAWMSGLIMTTVLHHQQAHFHNIHSILS